jgi:hypothetical protein
MNLPLPELSRLLPVSKVGDGVLSVVVIATVDECTAVAKRMNVPAVGSLQCTFYLSLCSDGQSVFAKGCLHSLLTQICVLSAEEFQTSVDEAFKVRFVPSELDRDQIDFDCVDYIAFEENSIDLGEAAVQQLGLAMDVYPRCSGAKPPEMKDDGDKAQFSDIEEREPTIRPNR